MNILINLYVNEVEDYFRRMGGQGCYESYRDWHPSVLILCLLLELSVDENVHPAMLTKTDNLPSKIKKKLDLLEVDKQTLDEFIKFIKSHLIKIDSSEIDRFEMFLDQNKAVYDKFYEAL